MLASLVEIDYSFLLCNKYDEFHCDIQPSFSQRISPYEIDLKDFIR